MKNIPVSKLFISNLHKKDREEWEKGGGGREERKRIKGLKRKLSNTDSNMRDNVTRYIYFVDIQLLILAMNRKIQRKFGKGTEECRKTET